jgi:arsenate reductase
MAEAFLNQLGGRKYSAESAGYEPGTLNPLVVEVMKEINLDISENKTKSVFDLYKEGRLYQFVIAVCDGANAQRCPVFPGMTNTINWSIEDPSSFTGSYLEKLEKTRIVRDKIKAEIEKFLDKDW